jgi:hypothetical protein
VRKELFWDRDGLRVSPGTELERAINYGGFAYISELQKKYGLEAFVHVLTSNRNLSKKAVNFWCLVLGIEREKTAVFRNSFTIWSPLR